MKVTIVGGGGVVGSSAAYRIAQDGLAYEIILFDSRRNLAEAHALDIEQALVNRANTLTRAGEIEDTIGFGCPYYSSCGCGSTHPALKGKEF